MAHQLTNFKQTPFPISYTQQIDVHRNNMRTVLLYRAVGIIGIGLSHSKVNRLYLGIVFLEFIRYAQCHIPRDFGTCTDRQLQIHCDTGVILCREKLGRNHFRKHHTSHKNENGYNNDERPMSYRPSKETRVSPVEGIEGSLYGRKYQSIQPSFFRIETQPLRTKHRRKRQSRHGGNYHNDADNPPQLTEQNTCHTGNQCQRQEHGQHGKGRSNNRNSNLIGTVYGCLFRSTSSLDVVRYVFKHHDSIVDNHTYRYTQRTQRYDIQRISRDQQITERGDQRYRDRNNDDECSSPTTQEYQYDQHDDDKRYQNRLDKTADSIFDIGGSIDDDTELHIRRQFGLYGR